MMGFGYLAGASMVLVPGTAVAHPGLEHELGMGHVLTSVTHVVVFLLAGAVAGIVMKGWRSRSVIPVNFGLILLLLLQGVPHAMQGGVLFGLETMLGGAALAFAGSQIARVLRGRARTRSRVRAKRPDRYGH